MKKLLVLILATLMTLALSHVALANDDVQGVQQSFDSEVNLNWDNDVDIDIDIDKDVDIHKRICIKGSEEGKILVDGEVNALVDNKQVIKENHVFNLRIINKAKIDGNALENAEGNIGVNVAAGDFNAQDNAAALAAGEAANSSVEASANKLQMSFDNEVKNIGTTNKAKITDSALMNAKGNIGVNVAAGNFNAQSNMLAVTVAPAKVGMAEVAIQQETAQNTVCNVPSVELVTLPFRVDVSLEGSTEGQSYQMSNFYPDTWTLNPDVDPHAQHPTSPLQAGHLDMDNQTQGAVANPDRTGVGGLAFDNVGTVELAGTVSGYTTVLLPVVPTTNTAILTGSALMNATGNIGVNVVAGTGNLQANALAVSYLPVTNGGGGGGGLE